MAAFLLSNLTGLLRTVLVSNVFGTQPELDAFTAASGYPDLIFNLVAGGALASAFVPTLTTFVAKDNRAGAWYLSSAVVNLVLLFLTAISLLSAVFAPQLVRNVLAPGMDPELQPLTVSLLRILLLAPTIFGVSGLVMGILNVHQIFLWPALAPSMYWLGSIFGLVFLTPEMGIYGLAWGGVLGAGLHLVVQLPALLRLPERRYFPTLGLQFPAVREVGRLMAPRLIGVAVVQLNALLNIILATAMSAGSMAAISYSWKIMTMPQVVIAQAIAIAALPTFSAQVARGELGEMRASLAATLRGVILLSLPASLGLILLRKPVVSLLFERGVFDQDSTELVAWALLWYSAGLVGHSVVEIVARAFYALHDTRTPVLVGAAAMSLNLLFSLAFSALFARVGWMPHGGLALANSLATALEMAGLLYLMRRRLHGLDGRYLSRGVLRTAVATLVMSLAIWLWLAGTAGQPVWLSALGGVLVGGLAFGALVMVLRVEEAFQLLAALRRRLIPGR